MIVAGVTLLALLWTAAVGTCWAKTMASARLWLCILGVLTGVGIVMLSGRTVGLLWIMAGATGLLGSLYVQRPMVMAKVTWRPRLIPHFLWAVPMALLWLIVLLWEPSPITPLVPKAVELAQAVGIAFAHHTWAVVGVALLSVVMLSSQSPARES